MRNKAQSTLEYAVIIAVVAAGLLAIQTYMTRGVQGKLRESTDRIGEQYSAGNITSKSTTEQIGPLTTQETFGLNDAGNFVAATADAQGSKGLSIFKVKTPAEIDRSTVGMSAGKVTVTKTLDAEAKQGLFSK